MKSHWILGAAFCFAVLAHALDVHSTDVALSRGATESDPEVRGILDAHGVAGFAWYKVALLTVLAGSCVAAAWFVPRVGPVAAYTAVAVAGLPAVAVSIHNYVLAGRLL